ncbi:unnamed protein product [Zymoseptoria tritici ST99CH_1A5]|uniref:BTB domain-containing protein n=1 Tax=Zymoseptoria tritici ST99CH_1A5 TaxID=1276529 RepID=A0A1Y6LA77_ZYMTR|nr:unnamed protein product [Zymoseptoria tritici ST99CH_1A5]
MADPHDEPAPAKRSEDTQTTTSPPKDTVIIEEGDTLLVCADAEELGKLRVSSIILKHTSPVFKAMLGPHFAEGQVPRSALHPQELHCPEDDWHAMKCLMQLLHHSKSWLQDDLCNSGTLERLIGLGVVADKYACIEAIFLQVDTVFAHFRNSHIAAGPHPDVSSDSAGLRDCFDLATAAVHFGKHSYFYFFTKRLVMDFVGPYSSVLTTRPGSEDTALSLKLNILLKLEEQRNAIRVRIGEHIPSLAIFSCHYCGGGYQSKSTVFMPAFEKAIKLETHWPPTFSSLSIRTVLEKLKNVGNIGWGHVCGHHGSLVRKAREFEDFAAEVYNSMAGMCSRCAKAGSFTTGSCGVSGHWVPTAHWKDGI